MKPPDLPAAQARTDWPVVMLLVGAGVVAAFQIGKAPSALPALRDDLGLGLVGAGWVISIFNLLGVVLGTTVGAFADRTGHRRAALAGLALIAVSSLVGSLAQGPAPLLASRFCEGLGFLVVVVSMPTLIVRAARPADLSLAFSLWSSYMPAGTAAMLALSPLVMAPFGWRGLWLANAVLVALFALALAVATRGLLTGPASSAAPRASVVQDISRTVTMPGPPLLALIFGTYTLQFLSVLGFLPTILVEGEGMPQAWAAGLTALAIAANVPGNLLGGFLLHRGARHWALIAGASVAMALCALGIYQTGLPLWLRYGLCVLLSFIGGLIPASVFGAAPMLAPSPRLVATTNGLVMQGSNLGQVVGPPAVAALAAASGGWHWSPAVLVASAGLGAGLALILRTLEHHRSGR